MIEVSHLSKVFEDYKRGPVAAVNDVTFSCHPGEIFGLLGPNGAGKTTTLRMLSTVLRPSSGRASIAGFDVVKQPQQVRENIGFMSNATAIYDRLTAWETVEFFGKLNGMPKPLLKERMEEIFEWLQMNSFRDLLGSKIDHESDGGVRSHESYRPGVCSVAGDPRGAADWQQKQR